MKNSVNPKCPLCRGEKYEEFHEVSGVSIVTCLDCGLKYSHPMPDDKALEKIYGEDYFSSEKPDQMAYADYNAEEREIRRASRKKLKWISKYAPPPGKLLDVGCATGFFIDTARKMGWDAAGTDISDYCIKYAAERFGLEVYTGKIGDIKLKNGSFDVITMWDVLEHLKDPVSDIRTIHKLLKPGGVFTVMTPNIKSAIARVTGKGWILYQSPHIHLLYFSEETIRILLEVNGFEILKIKKFWHGGKYVPVRYALERLEIYSKIFKPLRWFCRVTRIERLTPFLDIGDNMVIYARKKAGTAQ